MDLAISKRVKRVIVKNLNRIVTALLDAVMIAKILNHNTILTCPSTTDMHRYNHTGSALNLYIHTHLTVYVITNARKLVDCNIN